MATALSVNLNKVALVRNSRDGQDPDVVWFAQICIEAGCQGITVHPRPDQRHVRPDDVRRLCEFLRREHPEVEYNIEGNPFAGPEPNGYPGFIELVKEARPEQVTLVPDSPDQLTSDHGWRMTDDAYARLEPVMKELVELGCRISLFVDDDIDEASLQKIKALGAHRVELYTGPYAEAYGTPEHKAMLTRYAEAGERARAAGLELNAGHDLNLDNLGDFLVEVKEVKEVSIGHALIVDALEMGYLDAVKAYLDLTSQV